MIVFEKLEEFVGATVIGVWSIGEGDTSEVWIEFDNGKTLWFDDCFDKVSIEEF